MGAGGEVSSTGEKSNNHPGQGNGPFFPLEGWEKQEAPAARQIGHLRTESEA